MRIAEALIRTEMPDSYIKNGVVFRRGKCFGTVCEVIKKVIAQRR